MQQCSGGRQYTPRPHIILPSPALPQWVYIPMSYTVDVWVLCLPYTGPSGDGIPQGPYSARGSPPTSTNQTKAPLLSPPHKIYLPSSYTSPLPPEYSPCVPTFTTLAVDYAPPPANHFQKTKQCVPSTLMKVLTSAAYNTPMKPPPTVPLSPQQPTSVASYQTSSST